VKALVSLKNTCNKNLKSNNKLHLLLLSLKEFWMSQPQLGAHIEHCERKMERKLPDLNEFL